MHSVLLVGNFTLDEIVIGNCHYSCIGGPPSYAGLFLSTYKVKLTIAGCYGYETQMVIDSLKGRGANVIPSCNGCQVTSKFRLVGSKKKIVTIIDPGCRVTDIPEGYYDYAIINGVCGEVSTDLINEIRKRSKFVYLDPQGLLRKRKRGKVEMAFGQELIEAVKHADVLKANCEELELITGTADPEKAHDYFGKSTTLVFSESYRVTQIGNGKILELAFKPLRIYDGVGMGDLFGAGYVLGVMISGEKMGLAMGHAAATARPMERGLFKVPHWREVMSMAKSLMGSVKEQRL
ncbi:MAG: hypothetical protein QW431_05985 [Conexivisphaerales archaeon]